MFSFVFLSLLGYILLYIQTDETVSAFGLPHKPGYEIRERQTHHTWSCPSQQIYDIYTRKCRNKYQPVTKTSKKRTRKPLQKHVHSRPTKPVTKTSMPRIPNLVVSNKRTGKPFQKHVNSRPTKRMKECPTLASSAHHGKVAFNKTTSQQAQQSNVTLSNLCPKGCLCTQKGHKTNKYTIENKFTTTGLYKLVIPKFKEVGLKCPNPQIYHRYEYTMSPDGHSAVSIKKTGEVLQSEYYFTSGSSANHSQAIFVCRQHHFTNCSGQWILVEEGQFTVVENKSIILNANPRRRYDLSKYIWQNRSVVICRNISQTETEGSNRNCSGTFVMMEEGEFTVLKNRSIFVNVTKRLYDKTKYIWYNKRLYICENFPHVHFNDQSSHHDAILATLTDACMGVSIVALVFLLVTYSLFSELRTPPGINVMNLSVSILFAQLLWTIASDKTDNSIACTATAVLLHYFFLVSFLWTAIIAFNTWKVITAKFSVAQANSRRKRFVDCVRNAAIAWFSVMVYVAICIAVDQSGTVQIGYGSRYACWIADNNARLYFFCIPVGLVLIFNAVFYSMTLQAIRNTNNQTRLATNYAEKKRTFGIYVKIGTLMGFTWILGIVTPARGSDWMFLSYIFIVLNSLQGVYITVAFALSGRARKLYLDMIRDKFSPKNKE